MTTKKEREILEAKQELLKTLKPGDTLYTKVNHVSRSGMMRHIDVYVMRDNSPQWLTYWVSKLLQWPLAKHDNGIKVSGCGMDMGFHLVYSTSYSLFHDQDIDRPGYALKQRWL